MSGDYFRFLFDERVEPTNNHSEQEVKRPICRLDQNLVSAVLDLRDDAPKVHANGSV